MSARILCLAALLSGCNAIFGLEKVEPLETSSSQSQGGASTTTTSSGGASSAGGAGGAGGQGTCDSATLGTDTGCDSGFKCSITTVPDGPPGCVPAGSRPAWSRCDVDTQCAVGTWCDLVRGVCKPVCNNAACAGNGTCIDAPDGNDGVVANLQVCVADCEPVGATPCHQGNGDVSCVRTPGGLDCMQSGGLPLLQGCVYDGQCAPGLMCYASNHCDRWCTMGGTDCPSGYTCVSVNPQVFSADNSTEYGVCGLN